MTVAAVGSLEVLHDIDVSCWKLTLPVDAEGGSEGVAAEVKSLAPTYRKAPWFDVSQGALVFAAPATGATTSGSHYPRCELRELAADGSAAAWTVKDGGRLSATVAVHELPRTSKGAPGRIVIGQIHGKKDELCRLYYTDGKLAFHDDRSGTEKKERAFELLSKDGAGTRIPLDARFDYAIEVRGEELTVKAVHEGVEYSASEAIGPFWEGHPVYFKAGVYVQVGKEGSGAGTTGTGRARVSFYKLSRSHP